MRMLSFIPDYPMLKLQYRIKMGRKLDLKNPKRYSEKLQWYKLYYRNPIMKQCVDKYEVRKYVEQCGLGHILNECYGVYDKPEEINFDRLPNSFIVKDTLGGGGNSVILIKDKFKIDWSKITKQLALWVNEPFQKKHVAREWVYEQKKHRIIIERLLVDEGEDLPDYKFFCFSGKPYCLYLMESYVNHHEQGKLGFLTPDFELMKVARADFAHIREQPIKPQNYDEMVRVAKILAKDFPHVRVDMFNINGKIVFGELTFFTASGYMKFEPDEFDFVMGKEFGLTHIKPVKPTTTFW